MSNGCLRDALSFLDQISKFDGEINIDIIERNFGVLSISKLTDLYKYIYNNDKSSINSKIDEISISGLTPLNFINEIVEYLLNKIITNDYESNKEMVAIKELIFRLNSMILNFNSIVNPFTLIKVELITCDYFPGNKNVNISQEIKNDNVGIIKDNVDNVNINLNNVKEIIIDNENIMQDIVEKVTYNDIEIDKIKKIRINNSFVNPSKDLKSNFISNWNILIENLNIENEYTFLGYIENGNIEVVSETNVIFSFKTLSDSIIFNNNLLFIESKYNDKFEKNLKFIGISMEEWNKEKQKFINNKYKKYEYIDELKEIEIKEDIKTKNIAEDIFGDDILEIK